MFLARCPMSRVLCETWGFSFYLTHGWPIDSVSRFDRSSQKGLLLRATGTCAHSAVFPMVYPNYKLSSDRSFRVPQGNGSVVEGPAVLPTGYRNSSRPLKKADAS